MEVIDNHECPLTKLHSTVTFILLNSLSPSSRECNPLDVILTDKPSLYTSKYVPAIPLSRYLERISCYASLSDQTLICALIYVDRFILAKNVVLTSHEIHRVMLTACVLAMKFYNDDYYDNGYYAMVGGVSLEELNALELDFLTTIDYKLNVDRREYRRYKKAILSYTNPDTAHKLSIDTNRRLL